MKTFQELGITELEHTSLIKVLELLTSGAIEYRETDDSSDLDIPAAFNMAATGDNSDCGSVCCIGGWTNVFMQGAKPNQNGIYVFDEDQAEEYVFNATGALHTLFFPENREEYITITAAQAAEALTNYLETGAPKWEEILPEVEV